MSAVSPTPPIPTYDRFIEPLLRCLARRPEGVAAREAHEAAADALGLDALARQQLLSSGAQLVYKNRAGWAHDRLKRAGLSDSPRRGWWQLTEAGRRFVVEHAGPLSAEQVAALAMSHLEARLRPVAAEAGDDAAVVQSVASPEERLGLALEEIRRAVVAELLDTLASVTPAFFETLVLDLLHRMGYGANRADLQRVGGSGDAGIDGIILHHAVVDSAPLRYLPPLVNHVRCQRLECLTFGPHRLGHAGILGRYGLDGFPVPLSFGQRQCPAVGTGRQRGPCAQGQQGSQIVVAGLGDVPQQLLATGTVSPQYQPELGGEMVTVREVTPVAGVRQQRVGRSRADAGHLYQAKRAVIGVGHSRHILAVLGPAFIESAQLVEHIHSDDPSLVRKRFGLRKCGLRHKCNHNAELAHQVSQVVDGGGASPDSAITHAYKVRSTKIRRHQTRGIAEAYSGAYHWARPTMLLCEWCRTATWLRSPAIDWTARSDAPDGLWWWASTPFKVNNF